MSFFLVFTGCSLFGGGQEVVTSPEPSPTTVADDGQTDTTDMTTNNTNGGTDNNQTTDTVMPGAYKINDPQAILSRAKESFSKANGLATKWQTDAKLILISTNYIGDYEDKGVIDQYIFISDNQKDMLFAVNVPRDDHSKFNRMLIFKEDVPLSSKVKPLPLQYWKINYAQALEKADAMGGYSYRRDHPNFQMSQTLSLVENRNMAWTMIYKSQDGKDFEVVLDSSSGQEIKK